jgi:hypothetical protein
MLFLSPLFLAGALAAALPIVLHLLKREPENRVRFSAVHLLRRAPVERSSRRRLRELLLLALRVAALLLLAFAFARPFFSSGAAAAGETTVIALDTSLSMSAPGQFEKARQLAKQAVERASSGLIAVVTFNDNAQIASQPSTDRGTATAAIDAARPTAGATRYRAALNAGVDLLRGRPGTVVVVSDLQETGWDAGDHVVIPDSTRVEVVDVGAAPPNLAVTSAQVSGDRITASVRNSGAKSADAQLRVDVHDASDRGKATRVASESTIPVGPGQTAIATFPAPKGQWAAVTVVDPTGAQGDNARYLILDTSSKPTVLVITTSGDLGRDGFYLQQALIASGGDHRAYDVESVSTSDLTSWDQARLDAHTAIVLTSTKALEHHGRELIGAYLKQGGGMLVAAGPEVDGDVLQEVLAGPRIAVTDADVTAPGSATARTWGATDVRHPVVKAFGPAQGALGLVQFSRVATVRTQDCSTIARFTTGEPALVDCPAGDGHALVVASDLDNHGNDFPLHATFVPFVHESMRYLSGGQRRVAEYVVADVPAGVAPVPGVAPIGTGRSSNLVAVNVDPAESDPGRLSPAEFRSAVATMGGAAQAGAALQAQEQEERQHIWQYVLGIMLIVMIGETYLATRTG